MLRILVLIALFPTAISVSAQSAPKRDLSKYDNGGTVDFTWDRHCEWGFLAERLREFVWRHFKEHHRGYIEQRAYSIEGDPGYWNVFIEPDEKGMWRVVIEARYECCWFYGMQKPRRKRETSRETIFLSTVERVEAKYWPCGREPTKVGGPIGADETLLPNTYQLILKTGDSKEPRATF